MAKAFGFPPEDQDKIPATILLKWSLDTGKSDE
jgi:hypothetical protein